MSITPEQARAELARRATASTTPARVTPEQARAELAKRQAATVPEKSTFGSKVKNFVGGAVYGASAPGRIIQNLASKAVDKVTGTEGFGATSRQGFQGASGVDLESTAGKVGEFAGQTAASLALPGGLFKSGVGAIAKGRVGQGIITGIKAGAAAGGAAGADRSLQDPNASALGVVGSTLGGAAKGAIVGGVTGGLLPGPVAATRVPGALKDAAPKIMQRVARIGALDQQKFAQTAGEDVGSYLVKRGIYGNDEQITKQLADRFIKSKTTADEALAKLGGNWRIEPVTTVLRELAEREKTISTPGAPSRSLATVTNLLAKDQAGGLTMSEINEVKRLYERTARLDYLRQNLPRDSERAKTLDSAIRTWQFAQAKKLGLNNLDEINKETQLARMLGDALFKKNARAGGNNSFGLTDAILISGGDPQAISMLLAKKSFGSKEFQSAMAKMFAPKPTIGAPSANNRNPITDTSRMLPPGQPAIYAGSPNRPDMSGTDIEGVRRMNQYYEKLRREAQLALPPGQQPAIPGKTIGLPPARSMEKGVPKPTYP